MTMIDHLLPHPSFFQGDTSMGGCKMRSKGWKQSCNVSSAPFSPMSWPPRGYKKAQDCGATGLLLSFWWKQQTLWMPFPRKIHEFWLIRGHFSLMARYPAWFLTIYFSVVIISRGPCQLYLMILLPLHLQIWYRARFAWQKKKTIMRQPATCLSSLQKKNPRFFPPNRFSKPVSKCENLNPFTPPSVSELQH